MLPSLLLSKGSGVWSGAGLEGFIDFWYIRGVFSWFFEGVSEISKEELLAEKWTTLIYKVGLI